ncbi:MAG: class I SAM-dependent methyltransferase [Solirubrobacteraceae bacterium]
MDQVTVNEMQWRKASHVGAYANRSLLPVEVMLLVRYRSQLSGRVIEVGCGAGRVLGYLVALGGEVHGIDLSPAMVDYCLRAYPEADVRVGDVAALAETIPGPFDAIVAADNLLDVFDDARRRSVLAHLGSLLAPGGVLIFSSHRLAEVDQRLLPRRGSRLAGRVADFLVRHTVLQLASAAVRLPVRLRNRRRLAPLQRSGAGYAIVNDEACDYGLLHYYVQRDVQERQLREAGLELVECLDPEGRRVPAGTDGDGPWLHYVAQRAGGPRPQERARAGD